jgi:phosphomannomutase
MTLIKSISGIRGTIGGLPGDNLTPLDIVKFVSAYAQWLSKRIQGKQLTVVVGRDARVSGPMVQNIVCGTLQGCGIHVIDIGMATTPTTEIAVTHLKAQGGIILTASHNPAQWNALKLLNEAGEFLTATDGESILMYAEEENFNFCSFDKLGSLTSFQGMDQIHINHVLQLEAVDVKAIRGAKLSVAIDCVNSVGGIVLPQLLKVLGVKEVIELYCEPNGLFPHNPEPLPEHLTEISGLIKTRKADVGFVVDPDVDRLAIVNEDGSMFGEEYTLVAVADYILGLEAKGNSVSNLSSTLALRDITHKHGGRYEASAVGEVNVVSKMKETDAVIGGEGNGGVIYPRSHYGRDALVGIALFLTHLARSGMSCSQLRATYPHYVISKNKIELLPGIDVDAILVQIKNKYSSCRIIDIDGVKIHFEGEWVHLRKSNTEPIIRIYSESRSQQRAEELAQQIISDISGFIKA